MRPRPEQVEPPAGKGREPSEHFVHLGQGGGVGQRAGQVVGGLRRLAACQGRSGLFKRSVGGAAYIHDAEQ